jgi:methylmalonyl-CoA mutase cobalamin-binding subunit
MFDLLDASRHLRAAPAIEDNSFIRTEPKCHAHGVHGNVAAAEHGDPFTTCYGSRILGKLVRFHEVAAGEVFAGGINSVQVLSGMLRKLGSGAVAKENGVELLEKFVYRCGSANHEVGHQFYTELLNDIQFTTDDILWQPELGMP